MPRLTACLSLLITALALSGCGNTSPSSATVSEAPSYTPVQVSPQTTQGTGTATALPLSSTTEANESIQGGTMSTILYTEYSYFQLEGIPPYPSQYVAIDAQDKMWVNLDDANKIRYERMYRTRETTPVEGIERYFIGTGVGGKRKECSLYDGEETCTELDIVDKKTFAIWLEEFTAVNRKMLANNSNASAIGGYEYKGIVTDPEWGEVHVFERGGTAQASDLYYGKPMVETMKLDTAQLRLIELTKVIMADGESIVHSSYRLVRWETIDITQAPERVFEIN